MASNTIILTKPDAGQTLDHTVPSETSARLNYEAGDIEGLAIGADGELIITFVDGGQVNITNFESFVNDGNLLYLNDGTLVDSSILTNAPLQPQALNTIETAAGDSTKTISQPEAGTVQEVTIEEGVNYVCDFNPENAALVETKDGQMILTFADGSQVVINNYSDVVAGQLPEELTVSSAETVETELTETTDVIDIEEPDVEVLEVVEETEGESESGERVANIEPAAGENLDAIAEQLQEIEPAAGEAGGAGNSGYGFNSSPVEVSFVAPPAIGPLGPTALQYQAPQFVPEQLREESPVNGRPGFNADNVTLDETDLSGGPISTTGNVNIDYGSDGPGSLGPNGDFTAVCDVAGGTLSSGGENVLVTTTNDGYEGRLADNTLVFTFTLNVDTGEYEYEQFEPFDHSDTANDNEPICLNFGIVATDGDGDSVSTDIVVNVLDDAPIVTSQPDYNVDESNANGAGEIIQTGQFFADAGQDVEATYAGSDNFNATGSLVGPDLTSNGVPVVVTYDAGTSTYTGVAGPNTVFTLEIDPQTGEFTYTQSEPLDHADGNDPDDVITLEFGAQITDYDGDTKEGTIKINVADDAPEIKSAQDTVDETDLGPIVVNGNVVVDFGYDENGTFDSNGDFAASGSKAPGPLTSGGDTVTVTFDPNTNTYTGATATDTIFTMVINSNGSYTFELLGTLDHADPNNPNDIINLDFNVNATDSDGDTDESTIRIRVKDDVPTIGDSSGDVDETNLDGGPLVHTDILDTNFGQELGSVAANGITSSSTPLLHDGDVVTITFDAGTNTYTGATATDTIFTLVVDPNTGEYTYTQLDTLDHPNTGDPDDVISINFGVGITSTDGDNDTGTITINVADDGPVANDDINGAEESQLITGNVVANDELSEDADNTVTNVNFKGTDYAVNQGVATVINGDFGTLSIESDGTYSYIANDNDPDGTDQFVYTLTDGDGDSDTAKLSIRVTPDGEPVAVDEMLAVDETNLTPGPMIFNGDLDVDFGLDGAGSVTANNNFSPSGSLKDGTFTSNDVPVNVTLAGNTYTGMAGAELIFTLEINNDGTYTFQLFSHIDHEDATDPNDLIVLEFGVTATDADGDSTDGTVTIQVYDDAPVAYDDGTSAVTEGASVSGNVTTNDELSEDKPNYVTEVVFNNVSTPVALVGDTVINGQYGSLTINSLGAYTYTAHNNNPDGTDTFTYVLKDFDGDEDTAEISFRTTPENDCPEIIKPAKETVDETNLDKGALTDTGTIQANFFNDGPGTIDPNNNFTSSVPLTSGGVAVIVTVVGDSYIGSANGTTIFTLEILDNGNYTYTQTGVLDHPDTNDHDDEILLQFGVTATDKDGDTASTTLDVCVKDDGPSIENKAKPIDESDADNNGVISYTHTLTHDYGEDGPGSIDPNGTFQAKYQAGGQNQTLTSDGKAIVVTETNNGYKGVANGVTIFTLTVKDNGEYTYTQFKPVDHPDGHNHDDVIWLKFGVEIIDNDGDTDDAFIIVDLHDDGPKAVDDKDYAKECETVHGDVTKNDDFGYDGEGRVISVKFDGTTHVVKETGVTTITGDYGVLEIKADGTYTYTANNHINSSGDDVFTYTIKDNDGDKSSAHLCLTVEQGANDTPTIESKARPVDESDANAQGVISYTNSLTHDYGNDGPGSIDPNGSFVAKYQVGGQNQTLTSCGHEIKVTKTANGYKGVADGDTVFTLTIKDNGEYTYTQYQQVDHPDAYDHDDVIWLKFGVTISDKDGDTDDGTITIDLHDDGPVAQNDTKSVDEKQTVTGDVTNNDDFGYDGEGQVSAVKFGTNTKTITEGGTTTINGNYGVLTIKSDGTYSYKANDLNVDANKMDVFTYTIKDKDGDKDTATLKITVDGDVPPPVDYHPDIVKPGTKTVDESNDNNGKLTTNGKVEADFKGDGPGTIDPNGTFTSSENNLTHCGKAVNVTVQGDKYVGKADGKTIFTLTINNDGTYKYEQFEALDHPDAHDHNDDIMLNFGVVAKDADGDKASTTIMIKVLDDGPVAQNDTKSVDEKQTVTGDVTNNDDFGYDGEGQVSAVKFGTNTKTITEGGTTTINGNYGVLTIKSDGTYSYKANDLNVDANKMDVFTYTIKDKDGDKDTATLKITVDGDVPPPVDYHPDIVKPGTKTVDESNDNNGKLTTNGKVEADFKGDGPGTIDPNGTFTSSENNLTHCGKAVNVTVQGDKYVGKADGKTIFTLTINNDGTYKYEQFEALDHPDAHDHNDDIMLNFGVVAKDADGDKASTTIMIKVLDDGPVAQNDTKSVDEKQTVTGDVTNNDDFGYDGEGQVSAVKFGTNTKTITEGGTTTINGNYGVLTIKSDGTYSYKANDLNVDANKMDVFTYTIKDKDGDKDTATLKITVDGDVPPPVDYHPDIVKPGTKTVDESNDNNGKLTTNGKVEADFKGDGPGTIDPNGTFTSSENNLTHCGKAVNVTVQGDKYVGKADGKTIFTLTINNDGTYKYEQFEALDHPDAHDHNDDIMLNFGVVAKDADGDKASTTIMIKVLDDGPVAQNDTKSVDEKQTVTGDVTNNDDFGYDGEGQVSAVKFGTNTKTITEGGTTTINGNYGVLTIKSDGTYSYKANDLNVDANKMDVFTYTIKDKDGDKDTATLKITVDGDVPPPVDYHPDIVKPGTKTVDESNDNNGKLTTNGKVEADFKGDGPGTIDPNGTFTSSENNLTHCGKAVNVTVQGDKYVGKADGKTIFTLTINNDGTYKYEQFEALDHPDAHDHNDDIMLNFGVVAKDADGDKASTTIMIKVLDDGPVAQNDTKSVDEKQTVTGDVTNNDDFGYDGEGQVSAVKFGTNTKTITEGGTTTINGNYGVLTIKSDGTYSYKANDLNVDANKMDVFTYTIKDKDGDKDTATLKITVDGDVPVVPGPDGGNDYCTLILPKTAFSSNLLANDTFTAGGGYVKSVKVGNTTHNVNANGVTSIAVAYGTLEIKSNGEYTFKLTNAGTTPTNSQDIQITIADANGKTDVTKLQLNILGQDLNGTSGQDTINGTSGNDVIDGKDGDDWIYGYDGDDTLIGGKGWDQVEGDKGNDTIYGNEGNDLLVGREGNDTIHGGSGNDDIYGDYDVNTTYGGADKLYGDAGDDYIYGGRGNDHIDGGSNNDILYGGRGNDTIIGGSGNDDIIGQQGNDTLTGGSGADTFWFLAINEGQDTIKDFGSNDKLELSNILTGYDAGEDINDFLFAVQSGGSTTLHANNNGDGNFGAATAIVKLEGENISVNDLFNNGNLIL